MFGDNLALIDRLQVNRGLNHASGFCFPYARRIDEPLEDRALLRIDIPQKGMWVYQVWQRVAAPKRGRRGAMVEEFRWVDRGRFTFEENKGPLARAYREAKDAHMAAQGEEEEEEAPSSDPLGGGWADAREILAAGRRQHADGSASGTSI